MNEEASISEEDFAELWDMWFSIMPFLASFDPTRNQIIIDIAYKFRDINHKNNLGLVEE
jgi:hypothetical protein